MTMPDRKDRKNQYRTAAATTENTNRMICAQVTLTPSISTVDCGRKFGNVGGLTGNQSVPMLAAIRMRPTVATTLIVSLAPFSVLAINSSSSPRIGATTRTEIAAAAPHGSPCSHRK